MTDQPLDLDAIGYMRHGQPKKAMRVALDEILALNPESPA